VNGHLAWANGDTTSYGLHADFLNGWDVDILNKALNDPGCVNIGKSIQIEKCPVLAPYFNIAAGKACKPSRGQLTEPFPQGDGNVVPKLPGCNLLWGATGPKPTCNPSPAALDVSAFLSTDGPYVVPTSQQYNSSLSLNQSKGWHSVACFSNTGNDRPLGSNTLSYYDSNMTPTRCQSSCARNGYTYAGLQIVGGFSCICSNTLNNQSAIAYSGCSTPCPSSTATCGGKRLASGCYASSDFSWLKGQYLTDVYYQAAAFVGRDSSAYDLGCYALPTNATSSGLIPASTYSFPSTSMTRDVCSQACVSKGAKWSAIRDSTCYCGTDFSMGTGYFVPSDFCSLTCKGNASETCGNYYAMNTFNLTNYAYKAPGTGSTGAGGYRGCFAQGSGKALSAYSFADSKLTPEMCKSYCNQLGYSLAGAMNGNQCSCDNTFQGGQMLPDSQCGTPCAGNSSSTCGAQYNIQLYNSSAAIYGAAQAMAAHPAGWQGCYAASLISSKTAYSNYTIYPDTLSVSSCKTTCAYFGYSYMALWGNSCNCGSQLVKTNRFADAFCNTKCKSSSETCGGSQYTDVYSVSANQAPDTSALRARGWVGCYNNPASGAALSSYSYAGSTMTPQICQAACLKNGGWKFSGVNRNLCTCGNSNMGIAQPPSSCTLACSGDANQICGGPYSYSIYTSASNASAVSSTVTASRTTTSSTASVKTSSAATSATTAGASDPFATYVYRGCIADGSSRAMNATSTYSGAMTVARCAAEAKSGGFKFFGMESGGQCFVTNKLAYVTPTTGCDVACPGDATKQTMCGGSWKISYYEYVASSGVPASTTSASTSKPTTATASTTSASTSKPTTATASMTLAGSSSSTVKTSTAAAPAASASYTARGCVADGATRALNGSSTSGADMTIAKCATFAQAAKARFFGLENGNQCFTGTVLAYNTTSTNCKTVCAGDASKATVCGGGYALSLYEFAPAVVPQYASPNLAAIRRSLHWSQQAQHRPLGRRARQLV
jgi:hypothetical protein